MTKNERLKKINEALDYLTEKGEIPQIKKIVSYLGMTPQNFYLSYKDHVDYVNCCIETFKFSKLAEEIKTEHKGFTLIDTFTSSNRYKNLLIQCPNQNHEPFLANRYSFKCPECTKEKLEKLGLARAHEIAKSHGGKCLSTSYTNQLSKLTFKCSNPDHAPWTTTFLNVQYGKSWCRACSNARKGKV